MTAIPSQTLPRPATDATVTAGLPEAGLSTRLDPSTAITQGTVGGRKFGARVMNWILGGFGDWLAYLRTSAGDRLTDTVITRRLPVASVIETGHAGSTHAFDVLGNPTGPTKEPVVQQNITACTFLFELSDVIPTHSLVETMSISVQADPGWTVLPTFKPMISLVYVINSTGAVFEVGPISDGSADAATFVARHDITIDLVDLTGLAQDFSNYNVRYFLCVHGAEDSSWQPVQYMNPRVTLRAAPWA